MRHPDITIWTAGPPTAVSQCTLQVRGGPGGVATYWYRVIAHYPIGSVISPAFIVRGAPKPTDAQHYVIVSWDPPASSGVLSYDVLRTPEEQLPPDGTPCGLALGVTSTRVLDQGQTLTPYSLSGLPHGSTTDGWAHMNNRDYDRPVLELWPTVRITSILFADGSEQQSAGGGVIAGVSSVFGRAGHVTAQAGDYNATQISLSPTIGTWTNVQQAITDLASSVTGGFWQAGTGGAIYYSGGNVGIKQANPQFSLDIAGSINVTGGFFLNGTLFAGTGVPLMAGVTPGLAHIGITPPASPEPGQFWFDSSTLKLLIRYGDDWMELTAPAKARRTP